MACGYKYSSSVIPAPVIGTGGLPALPHQCAAGVWEFHLPVFRLPLLSGNLERSAKDGQCPSCRVSPWRSIGIPYSGGLFMRCLGPGFDRMMLAYHLKKRGYAMVYAHPGELGGLNARWIGSLDDRYLNLAERWRLGYRTKGFKNHFQRIINDCGGCSIIEFLGRWRPVSRDFNRSDENVCR
jgi:hypothetical protein